MRKRTVQSVLARRSMFNNGGMVSPPAQATGILGSSPSLIDAVSNDALSDMGGGTLSMAQGGAAVNMQPSYVFNQGGIAKFDNGGMSTNNIVVKVLNGTATAAEIRAIEGSPFMERPEVAQAVRLYKGREPGGPLPLKPGADVKAWMASQAGEQLQNNKATDLKVGNLTAADRAIPTQMASVEQNVDTNELRRRGFPESEIRRLKKLGMAPLSAFMKPATDRNAQSPGEEAIVNIAESALARPVPQVEEPNIGVPVAGPGDASVVEVSKQDMEAPLGAAPDGSPAPEIAVTAEELPPVFDSSGDQGEGPPTVATAKEVDDQNQLFANLAEATNKNTETNAVDAVVAASNAMGGEGGAVGADGTMTTGDDTIIVRNDEGESKPVNSDVLISAFKLNGPETDENLQIAVSEDLEKMGTELIKGEPTNIDSLKKRIEALIPAVEDDPQTEGLLIAMLGASIAGGESPNAFKNISDGMQKVLPGLINFRAKQKSAKRARQTQIASLVIGEEFKREAENRAVSRTIDTENRAEARRLNILNTTRNSYVTTIPGTINGAMVPKKNFLRLSNEQIEKNPEYKKLGLVKMTGKVSATLDQIFKPEGVNVLSLKDKKTRNEITKGYWYEPKTMKTEFLESPLIYRTPSQAGIKYGGLEPGQYLEPREAQALTRGFKDKITPLLDLSKRVNSLHDIDPTKLVGFKGVQGRLATGLMAFGVANNGIAKQFVDAAFGLAEDGTQLKVSAADQFGIKGRYILAQLAPMFLNESGKTISDADRARVARLLGFSVEETKDKDGNVTSRTITGFNKELFNNPAAVTKAIEQVEDLLQKKMDDMTNRYETTRDRFGTSRSVMEGGETKNKYSMKKDPKAKTLPSILDVRSLLNKKKIRRGIAAGKRMIY